MHRKRPVKAYKDKNFEKENFNSKSSWSIRWPWSTRWLWWIFSWLKHDFSMTRQIPSWSYQRQWRLLIMIVANLYYQKQIHHGHFIDHNDVLLNVFSQTFCVGMRSLVFFRRLTLLSHTLNSQLLNHNHTEARVRRRVYKNISLLHVLEQI